MILMIPQLGQEDISDKTRWLSTKT
jgi:hypothetical protein